MAERGVACNVHYKPFSLHTAYKNMGFDIADYPNAYAHFANESVLSLYTCLTDEDRVIIGTIITEEDKWLIARMF